MGNNKGVYAPGELSRVRDKLGVIDKDEAKRMVQILGGEIGTERSHEIDALKSKRTSRRETVEVMVDGKGGRRSGRRIDMGAGGGEDYDEKTGKYKPKPEFYPGDDPSVPFKLSYRERTKMDQYAGQFIFEIKNSLQVFVSVLSFFREPVDYVNSRFVTKRLNEYYSKIEKPVTLTRNLFPKNNTKRTNQLKRASPFVFKIMETLRYWNIEQIASDIAELQAHPRAVKVSNFEDLLQQVYKPLFILSDLNSEHIKTAFKLVYKILYLESPMEAKEKYQDVIRNIIFALIEVRRDVQFGLYPLLMKLISDRFIPYERFFIERRRRYMAFINVTQQEQLNSAELTAQQIDKVDVESLQNTEGGEKNEGEGASAEENPEEDPNDPKVIARKEKEEAEKAEQKAMEKGEAVMESLFPKAGWEKLDEFPDMYPYFSSIYSMKGGYELIACTDPLQQASVLMHILDDLFIGVRYVNFATIVGSDGTPEKIGEEMKDIVSDWRRYIEESFSRDYLPRLSEYCRMLENSGDSRNSIFARKTLNELHWIRRLYFLPYYKFESLGPPPFQKQNIIPIYGQIRKLRKYLTAVAMGIEHGIHKGGAAAKAPCDGIINPWEPYNFPIPNPVSRRLDAMLPAERRNNATLIFFSLAAVTVLDFIVNNENSWSYGNRPGPLFRSLKDEGIVPIFGIDEKVDADKLFKNSLKKRSAENQ